MKHITRILLPVLLAVFLVGCTVPEPPAQIAATTLPVYEFTSRLCEGTGITVTRLVTEEVSCLHDYSLNVRQVKAAEAAELIVISGGGLEDFMADILRDANVIDASGFRIGFHDMTHVHSHEEEKHHENDGHHHETDPHVWLSPENALVMVDNIRGALSIQYPEYAETITKNAFVLFDELKDLKNYGEETLSDLSCRDLITFHDGFSYFAEAFDLHILEAVEEESGSEASAKELIHLIEEVDHHHLPAVFTEKSGSVSAAGIIARETGCGSYSLDMAMSGDSYFEAMYHNINTIKEALG